MSDSWPTGGRDRPFGVTTDLGQEEDVLTVPRGQRAKARDPRDSPPPHQLRLRAPNGQEFPLDQLITIGRAPGNSIVLEDSYVSRQHCRIVVSAGLAFAECLSTKRMWVNGNATRGAWLSEGAILTVGKTDLYVLREVGSGAPVRRR